MAKANDVGLGFQCPPGYEIGGDAVGAHHPASELPIPTKGAADVLKFQAPSGQILGDDLPMGSSIDGMTDNVLGYATRADLAEGCAAMPPNPSVESINPSMVNADEPALPPGVLGRANGWER